VKSRYSNKTATTNHINHESTIIELFLQKKNKLVNVVNSQYVTKPKTKINV